MRLAGEKKKKNDEKNRSHPRVGVCVVDAGVPGCGGCSTGGGRRDGGRLERDGAVPVSGGAARAADAGGGGDGARGAAGGGGERGGVCGRGDGPAVPRLRAGGGGDAAAVERDRVARVCGAHVERERLRGPVPVLDARARRGAGRRGARDDAARGPQRAGARVHDGHRRRARDRARLPREQPAHQRLPRRRLCAAPHALCRARARPGRAVPSAAPRAALGHRVHRLRVGVRPRAQHGPQRVRGIRLPRLCHYPISPGHLQKLMVSLSFAQLLKKQNTPS